MNTKHYYSPKQGRLPVFISDILNICDPVLAFDRIMEEIEIDKYLKPEPFSRLGRPGYNRVNMLKTILFGFMDTGYASLRELEDRCKTNIRYMYLMDYETPSYRSFSYFINEELTDSVQGIFKAIMSYIKKTDGVDLQHLYIDGSKFEANANKYSWVWKKATEKSRYRLYANITALFTEMNETLAYTGMKIDTGTEYTPECLETILDRYAYVCQIDEKDFVAGRGHRKSREQRYYEKLKGYIDKLREYVVKIKICGPDRNSYSKTDSSATFMRIKTDYMGNDQLLPAYNIQIGVADEYIAVVDVMQYRSDIDCFIPLMEKFHEMYGFYPKYPVADAGYGSYDNYLFCQEHGMEKYMKFTMYKKETSDDKYHNDPFRAVNFKTNENGKMVCPNGKEFNFAYRKPIKGNQYGRQEEYYTCEDCSGCPYAEKCKKTDKNRTVRINEELSAMHKEVIDNLESIHGAMLRMNRSIQAEGTFGIMKYDRWYKRTVRRGLESVRLELFLVSIGHNLYKYHNKRMKLREAA
ncbi:MAG: IS1182 family transposase [Lachnospiraceae bacterium]|nr:IS1182 family transposase [Lachnospiraceae bacterium]MBR5180509.1 IS1182 family transposase [Lachnospiraceae bacterium]